MILTKFYAIARQNCANYSAKGPNGMVDYCYPGPSICILKENRFCSYFDEAVITYKPFRDQGLQDEWKEHWRYQAAQKIDREAGLIVFPKAAGLVCRCGKTFTPTGRRQRQCPECRIESEKQTKKLMARKLRMRKRSGV